MFFCENLQFYSGFADNVVMRIYLLATFFCITSSTAFAQNIGNLYELSQDGRDIVMKMPASQGLRSGKFELTPVEASLAKNVAGIDKEVKDYVKATDPSNPYNLPSLGCSEGNGTPAKKVKESINRPGYETLQVKTTREQQEYERQAMARMEMEKDEYLAFVEYERRMGNFRVENVATLSALKAMYSTRNPSVNLDEMDPVDQDVALSAFLKEYLGRAPNKGAITQSIIYDATASGSGDFEKLTKKSKDELTLEQKVAIVSRMGARATVFMEDENDKKATKFGLGVAGDVAQVHDAVKYKDGKERVTSIGLAQSKWLKTLGLEDAYVVGFRATMGDEAATVAFDPKEKKFVAIGGPRDKSKMTDVFDSNGKLVKKVDARLLKVFKDVGRGNDFDTIFNHKYAVQKMGFSDATTRGHLFAGTTMQGEALYGAAVSKKYDTDYYGVEAGAGFGRSPIDEKTGVAVSRNQVYSRISQEVRTAKFDVNGVRTQAFVRNENEFLKLDTDDESDKSRQVRGLIQPGVRGETYMNKGKTKVKGEVVKSIYPSWDETDGKVENRERYAVKTGVEHQVTDNIDALIDSSIMVRNYSTAIANDVGISDTNNHMRMTIGTETSIMHDNAPSSIREDERTKIRARFEKQFVKQNASISVDFERQGDDNRVYLQGQWKF